RKEAEYSAGHGAQAIGRDHVAWKRIARIGSVWKLSCGCWIVDHDHVAVGVHRSGEIAGTFARRRKIELARFGILGPIPFGSRPEKRSISYDRPPHAAAVQPEVEIRWLWKP